MSNKKLTAPRKMKFSDFGKRHSRNGVASGSVQVPTIENNANLSSEQKIAMMSILTRTAARNGFQPAHGLAIIDQTEAGFTVGISWSGRAKKLHAEAGNTDLMVAFNAALHKSVKNKKFGHTLNTKRGRVQAAGRPAKTLSL